MGLDILTLIFFVYVIAAFYFLSLYILIYLRNRGEMFKFPKITKKYDLSIVVPCYNEEKHIAGTIQSLLDSNYSNLKKIIVVDDCSTDNSYNIIKQYAKKYARVMAVQTPKNTGKASGAKNYGSRFVKTELIGFTDADSYPKRDAIEKMIGYFDEKKVGAVTAAVLVQKRDRWIERLQSIEYKVIIFTRKLLGFIGAIYVTPGPLAIYRKKAFDVVGGFDETNMTEDIEITWHLAAKKYLVKMCIPAKVYTVAPKKTKVWFNQRIRWNVGGVQTMLKYKKSFLKKGILGNFILPFFVFQWFLGIFGLAVLIYRYVRRTIVQYLSTKYSVAAHAAILTIRDLNLTPNVLIFFGLTLLISNLLFISLALLHSKETEFKKHNIFTILFFAFFYLLAYPTILVVSMFKLITGRYKW